MAYGSGWRSPRGDCGAVAALRGGGVDGDNSGPCWSAAGATRSWAERSVRAEARAGRWAAGKGGPSGSGLLGQKGRGHVLGWNERGGPAGLLTGLGWFSGLGFFSSSIFFPFLTQTKLKLFEFKFEFEFKPSTQTNKTMHQHECTTKLALK